MYYNPSKKCPFQLERRTKASFGYNAGTFRYFFATENDFSEIKKADSN